ncbi:MAG: ATP-binding protein [Chloroflexi bacterium]|nr:ATP-binding protein [Chloroflexota bacterium]
MIERQITPRLVSLFEQYPFVTVTGPRQSGKTTLCRAAFPGLAYVSLEAPDQREFAESDPRGFLSQFNNGAILDEIQHVPELLSYLQVLADDSGRNSQFVLTGSEQFRLSEAISQSLAGRTALLRLLPFSMAERQRIGASGEIDDALFSGFYPRILDQNLNPRQALGDYFETYVERDVRRLGGIRDLSGFRRFVRLCAGRVSQLVNLSSLGADAGVSHTTAREWLSVLETSYIILRLQPFYSNLRKRLVKSPKLYFYDVGLASYLIGIESSRQVATHPLRGPLFENAVVAEALKYRFNRGMNPNLSFYRDSSGLECDLLYETGDGLTAIEVKSGSTVVSDYFGSLNRVAEIVTHISAKAVVYGGIARQSRSDCEVVPLGGFASTLERMDVDQEVIAFVQENMGFEADASDIDTLDVVYQRRILQIIWHIQNALAPFERLFRGIYQQSYISLGQHRVNSSSLLTSGNWDRTKSDHIVTRGFSLTEDKPLNIEHQFVFSDYTGSREIDSNLILSISWKLSGESLSQSVAIDQEGIAELEESISYSELQDGVIDRDLFVAKIMTHIMGRIVNLSEGR